MKPSLMIVLTTSVAACGGPSTPTLGDSSLTVDGTLDTSNEAGGDARDAQVEPDAPPLVCTSGDGSTFSQCCVWDPSSCPGTDMCTYHWTMASAEPNEGYCWPPQTLEAGQTCAKGNGKCAEGLWCAWEQPSDLTGVCRALCQRDDLQAHGCSSGELCHLMPELASGRMGYCAP